MLRGEAHRILSSKPLLDAWKSLGNTLQLAGSRTSGSEVEQELDILERCAREECACSVYKPKHPMKVCKRCWLAAYCNERCQIRYSNKIHLCLGLPFADSYRLSDWDTHKTICTRGRRGP